VGVVSPGKTGLGGSVLGEACIEVSPENLVRDD